MNDSRRRPLRAFVARVLHVLGLAITLQLPAALAQTIATPPDPSTVPVRLGPVLMTPTIALTNAGVDTNVFNVADTDHPESDVTATLTPQADIWMPVGRTWLHGNVKEDLIWYQTYSSQRAANTDAKLNWVVPLTRISFSVGGNWLAAKERPGYEIDLRAQRDETAYNGALEVRALSKTFFGVAGEQRTTSYDASAIFLGVSLRDELNRTVTNGDLTIRNELTPLTNLTIDVGREQDRFEFDPLRNSDSTQVTAGLKFDKLAFVSGGIKFGFRDFTPLSATVPPYQGATMAVDLSCVALASTRLALQASRDVQYSYDATQPYYVQTSISGSVTQQIFGPVDVQGRIIEARLAYTDAIGAVVANPDSVDHVRDYGVGVGYHVGQNLRISFNIDENDRDSPAVGQTYHDLRYGTAMTYGF
jgi:hypothetical protein